jgi:hypothetical protein
VLAARERLLDEEVLDPAVLAAAQQHDLGVLDRAPGAADLLVVGDDAARRLVVDDEAEVGLVVAHPERAGGDDRLEVVAEQPLLDLDAGVGRAVPAVGLGGDPVAAQPLRHQVGVALGERVDDARARELRQVLDEPGEAVGLAGEVDDLEAQAGATQRAAVGAQRGGTADAQLLLHVGHHAVVGGRGRAQHRHALRQPLEHVGDPPVVGAEVVAPVGDAVRLVDDQQADPLGEQRQHLGAEGRVVEPLGADQQHVDGVGGQQILDLRPRVAVGRVDRVRADPDPLRRRDLVAHQRQQRRDDQRRAGAGLAPQRGGEEVDRRLAPARPLHAQHARAVDHEVAHRLELVLTEGGARPRELTQELGGAVVDGGGGGRHGSSTLGHDPAGSPPGTPKKLLRSPKGFLRRGQ